MKKRTKKAYENLYDHPTALFEGVEVLLWPNGIPEILIRDVKRGHCMRITASVGPAGMGLRVSRTTLGTPMSVAGNREGDYEVIRLDHDAVEIGITQYNGDEESQAFKRWYRASAEERAAQGIQRPDAQCGGAVRGDEAEHKQ